MFGSPTPALAGDRYKHPTNLSADGTEYMMLDINEDPFGTTNLVADRRDVADYVRRHLEDPITSCRRSHSDAGYHVPYKPVNEFQEITGTWL